MSMYTRCSHCDTYFRVSREQLQASSGQVRCGRCHKVFDAFAALASQLPANAEEANAPSSPEAAPIASGVPQPVSNPSASALSMIPKPAEHPPFPPLAGPDASGRQAGTKGQILTLPDDLFGPGGVRRAQGPRWLWAAGSVILAATLLWQVLHFFATELAVRLPYLRPELAELCAWVGCVVALPQLADQLFIEASDLQMLDAAQPGEFVLTATIRNRAAVAQQLPLIELTLTDALSQIAARKVFRPADYVPASQDPTRGIGPSREIPIRLYLDTGELRPTGYRLYLFFA
jgi:predicted Zn finger-like uncharacterized protein